MSTVENKMKTSMKKKILKLLFGISSISLLIFLSISSIYMENQGESSLDASLQLGTQAAKASKDTLEKQTEEYLLSLVVSQAIYTDSMFDKVETGVNVLYDFSKSIISNPDKFDVLKTYYQDNKPENPDDASIVILAPGSNKEELKDRIDVISNMDYIFGPIFNNDDNVIAVYLGTEDGIFKRFPWRTISTETYDPRVRSWYISGANQIEYGWTMPYIGATVQELMVTCYKGVYDDNGSLLGVVAADVTIESLLELVSSQVKDIGKAYIIDKKGNVIAYPGKIDNYDYSKADNLLDTDNLGYKEIIDRMILGETGIRRYIDKQGDEMFLAYAPITSAGWSIGVEISVDKVIASALEIEEDIKTSTAATMVEIDRSIKKAQLSIILVFLGIMVVIRLIGKNMAERISKPIIKLTTAVKSVGSGDLDQSIEVDTGDEIEVLSHAFNEMNLDLKQHIEELKETTAAKEKIESELGVAKRIQASMLPRIFPAFPDREEFDIYASMKPAKEVGGDYYDYFLVGEEKLCFLIADVSGKGVPASLFMVVAKTLMKNEALRGIGPEEILHNVNNMLMEDNDEFLFVTCFLAILDIETGKLEYANAGHNPPLLSRHGDESFEYMKLDKNFVVGGMPDFEYSKDSLVLDKGDILYLYTDGVTEAMDEENKQYSEDRLRDRLTGIDLDKRSVTNIEEVIKSDVKDFTGEAEQSDDITMLVLKYRARG